MQITRIQKEFEITNLGKYRDLYVQSHTLQLADVFENLRNYHVINGRKRY